MLVNLCDYKQSVTLIENSGVQFLDFGLTPQAQPHAGRFVRKTANGPLLRLDYDADSDRYTLPTADGVAEVVRPESSHPLVDSLALLAGIWLPVPFLRVNPPRTFLSAPANWARMQVNALPEADRAGHSHRVTLAFDTRLADDADASALAPTMQDVHNGARFALAWRDNEVADFLDQTWTDGWLREAFVQAITAQDPDGEPDISQALKNFAYQAHWLNLLQMLGEQLTVPDVKLVTATLTTAPMAVDLILDVGNTHTCGVIIEDHGPANDGLRQTAELQVRNLSQPHRLNQPLFSSRLEFADAHFGKTHFSVASGRDDAFVWPSIARVGDEALTLAMRRPGSEGLSGLSSPRRYLWDETPAAHPWRFSQLNPKTAHEPPATALPLTNLMNDDGQPLYTLPLSARLPVFAPHYSRSALMTHMLCELLAQALCQINSVNNRLQMGFPNAPRQLRTLILTLPSAMPKQERALFYRRMEQALALVWKAQGWHPQDDDFADVDSRARSRVPVPQIQMDWDEASCGQLVWLYNEAMVQYQGQMAPFFAALSRRDCSPSPDDGRALRVASLDIGGGTSDMAIVHYQLDDGSGSNVKIAPSLLFREGVKVAGDDLLLDVIQRCVLPAIQAALHQAGVMDAPALMDRLFGDAGRMDIQAVLRQQTTLQLLIPLGHAILHGWACSDAADALAGLYAQVDDLLTQPLTDNVQHYLQQAIQHELPADAAAFDVLTVPLQVNFGDLTAALLAGDLRLSAPLHALCEAISHYQCDVLLLTGRPACLPGVRALLRQLQPVPVSRMVWLDSYSVQDGYPFSSQGHSGNPKSSAAVGAMLCSLALDLRLPRFNFKAADIGTYSTVRLLGVLDDGARLLPDDNVWYRDIDLDRPGATLDEHLQFPLRGGVVLGFRQLDNPRWPATPLYRLDITHPELAKTLAGDGVLYVRLMLSGGSATSSPTGLTLADAWLNDGTPVPHDRLTFSLNTLAGRRSDYWIDSGSVYLNAN